MEKKFWFFFFVVLISANLLVYLISTQKPKPVFGSLDTVSSIVNIYYILFGLIIVAAVIILILTILRERLSEVYV